MKKITWGVATASYQIEGGYREDGKGDSIWDVYCHTEGNIKHGDTGDVACDHYHRYKEDIALLKTLGVTSYRFSIAWTRVLPDGIGKVNEQGIEFYNNLIDELLKNGIEPYITLFHWDYPQKLFEKGGLLNPDSHKWFGEYARLIGERFGQKVKYFITINEPQCVLGGYRGGRKAPGVKYSLKDQLTIAHNLMKSHGEAVKMLRATVPDCKIGYAPCAWVVIPKDNSPEAVEEARRAYFSIWQYPTDCVSLFSDPVILGDYPKEYYQKFKDVLPDFQPGDLELISQPIDFYCQNIYSGNYVEKRNSNNYPVWEETPSDFPRNALGWSIIPQALYWGPKFLYERYFFSRLLWYKIVSYYERSF